MIRTLLIANRGEIACRIARTGRQLGIRVVAVYAPDDAVARHVSEADEAICLASNVAGLSPYLDGEAIIAAAQRCAADAIHPGYGFLAENAGFARACAEAGLLFIGPTPEAIAAMGSKRAAKALLKKRGIPVVPGYIDDMQTDTALQRAAGRLGYPIMIKAADGGGGKGMRTVEQPADLLEALSAARSEARHAFDSDSLILERALAGTRHVEFQVFGDHFGQIIHLGERECSLQRRYQKVIEEAPSPALTPELRSQMGQTAVAVAEAINYTNAGTVEFLLDRDDQFYFLEMNTRLQVEHPVTELVTGQDLVEWQIRVAEGEPLPLTQEEVVISGHAMEARIYAENPAAGFLPVSGQVQLWRAPAGSGIRVDSGIQSGDEIPIHYDPLLAKVIAGGRDRKTARRRLIRALEGTSLLGVTSNLAFVGELLDHPDFAAGQVDTRFVERQFADWRPAVDETLALISATLVQLAERPAEGYWRNNPNQPQRFYYRLQGAAETIEVIARPPEAASAGIQVTVGEQSYQVDIEERSDPDWVVSVDGYRRPVTVLRRGDTWWVHSSQGDQCLQAVPLLSPPQPSIAAVGSLRAPMPGSILAILVEVGQVVARGQPLVKLEAMKMEHTIRAAAEGVVEAIHFSPGDTVEADAQLLRLGPQKA